MNPRPPFLFLPPNRVWRTYVGGRVLDGIAGRAHPADGHWPEDWIASATLARNPGDHPADEGLSRVPLPDGRQIAFAWLLAQDPEYYLGPAHCRRHGAHPQLLVKFLDPAIRLHCQVHPTSAFARERLAAPSGKTEAYHILATRPDAADACVWLGFHTPPGRAQLRRWIEGQDIPAILAAMNRVPVAPGDTLLVPGGVPHALGGGLLLVELQEPSDLVVRFEFARGDYVLPESARFMDRGLEFCLDVFDPAPWPPARIEREARLRPAPRRRLGPDSWQEDLIAAPYDSCFRLRRTRLRERVEKSEDDFHLLIVAEGACTVDAGGLTRRLARYDRIFVPAGTRRLGLCPEPVCTLLECCAPAP
jgi:mannose-6-phosphate isomerase